MHPNAYLKALWRRDILPQVFVAMSFDPKYKARYESVFRPAVEAIRLNGKSLKCVRVDESRSGDSIITDIVDGIAHSAIVLVDVSVLAVYNEGASDEKIYRNGNVMYELGVALACRQPDEVIIVRDDDKAFLFDISTIPHKRIDFSDHLSAIKTIRALIEDRLKERNLLWDARIQMVAACMSSDEIRLLKLFTRLPPNEAMDPRIEPVKGTKVLSNPDANGLRGLLDKGLLFVAGQLPDEGHAYAPTEIGRAAGRFIDKNMKQLIVSGPKKVDGIDGEQNN